MLGCRCISSSSIKITGSFKLRGGTNAVLNLSNELRGTGVVGVSTGNHGRGLAYAARANGIRCIICMSELVPQNKIDGIEGKEPRSASSAGRRTTRRWRPTG